MREAAREEPEAVGEVQQAGVRTQVRAVHREMGSRAVPRSRGGVLMREPAGRAAEGDAHEGRRTAVQLQAGEEQGQGSFGRHVGFGFG